MGKSNTRRRRGGVRMIRATAVTRPRHRRDGGTSAPALAHMVEALAGTARSLREAADHLERGVQLFRAVAHLSAGRVDALPDLLRILDRQEERLAELLPPLGGGSEDDGWEDEEAAEDGEDFGADEEEDDGEGDDWGDDEDEDGDGAAWREAV